MRHRDPDGANDPALAREAREALEAAGYSRRNFLKGTGALIVTFGLVDAKGALVQEGPRLANANARLDSWLAIGNDGRVTAYTGKCELGQGIHTAQLQLVAEELVVPTSRVTLVQCDTALTPDQGTTAGSQSHPENFNRRNLGQAAATAREALIRLGAERLKVPIDQLAAADGFVHVREDPARRVPYGELVGGRKFVMPIDTEVRRRSPAEWTVLGTSVPRLDFPAMVTGTFEFVHDVRVPGMMHGRVVRPPAASARLLAVNEASVRGMPGLIRAVVRNDFVGIVAEKAWQAVQAARALEVKWAAGTRLPARATLYETLRRRTPTRDTLLVDSGDVDSVLAASASVLKATYLHPYQMHGSLATSCAVADVRGEQATVWSATQACHPLKNTVAAVLGIELENVRVIFRTGSGCYGLNGADAVSYDAAILSQAVGRPVRVQLSRRDEALSESYGYAFVIDQRVGLDPSGRIAAWDYEAWYPILGARPGYASPGNILAGALAGFATPALTPRSPAPPPTSFDNNSNAVPPYVAGCVARRCGGTGTVRSERVVTHAVASAFFTGPLRSPWRLQNTFAHESFVDEVAAHVGADSVAYRLQHLSDSRLRAVLTAAARAAAWDPRPSPRPGIAPTGVAWGRGIAGVLYEGHNGYGAVVAGVEVDQASGAVRIVRLVAAIDCGPISNPDGVRNQTEGGALQGACRALMEEVTWDTEKVTSVDWRSYRTWTLGSEVPAVETVIVDRPGVEATGAGELSITVVGVAIGNAIFDATGARLREIPFTPARVKAALAARGKNGRGG